MKKYYTHTICKRNIMERVLRGKRASENQKEYLINYLEENVDLANDKFVTIDGAKYREQKWKELSVILNGLGGTQKDGSKWRKYWSDLRLHTRTKYNAIGQVEQNKCPNTLSWVKPLSPLEERIIKITTTEAVDCDEMSGVGFEVLLDPSELLFEQSLRDVPDTTTAISGASTSAAATIRGIATPRSRRLKRKPQSERDVIESFLKIEKKKLAEMETANHLKREQIAILRENTDAVKADTKAKEKVESKLQQLIDILVQKA